MHSVQPVRKVISTFVHSRNPLFWRCCDEIQRNRLNDKSSYQKLWADYLTKLWNRLCPNYYNFIMTDEIYMHYLFIMYEEIITIVFWSHEKIWLSQISIQILHRISRYHLYLKKINFRCVEVRISSNVIVLKFNIPVWILWFRKAEIWIRSLCSWTVISFVGIFLLKQRIFEVILTKIVHQCEEKLECINYECLLDIIM